MLVRLLQWRQVVLFTLNGERLYLFYHGKVYTTTIQLLNAIEPGQQLPKPKSWSSNVFIWTLFDIEKRKGPEMLSGDTTVFASPDSVTGPNPFPGLG